ncbi:MAG: hypothetical protein ABI763_03765 [Bacteroidota bacterium]
MKVLSVFGSMPQVVKRLQLFLNDNNFRHIEINDLTNEITAERRQFFVWKDYLHLKIKSAKSKVTNIELTLNPLHEHKTPGDENKELSLQNRIYLYF